MSFNNKLIIYFFFIDVKKIIYVYCYWWIGFIGSNLIEILLSKKFKVLNIDKISYASNFYNVKDFVKNKNYNFIKANINNQKKVLKFLKI